MPQKLIQKFSGVFTSVIGGIMLIQTDVIAYVIQFKEDGTYKSWVWDNLPEGTTHVPVKQYLNSRYYKVDGDKLFRWSSSSPCWDYCGKVGDIEWQRNLKEIEK